MHLLNIPRHAIYRQKNRKTIDRQFLSIARFLQIQNANND
jgi:hypothetical protein